MSYVLVAVVAVVASGLTLFSGFGLGTLLLPAFAFLFPVEIAIAATAIVHLANNLFKLALVGRHARGKVVAAFGLPAAAASFLGAFLLARLARLPAIASWELGGRERDVTVVGLVVAALILAFAVAELMPEGRTPRLGRRSIPLGGALSGFFGGLSGHQGALRSAFLIKAGLGKEAFIGTGVACSVLVDVARLSVYGPEFFTRHVAALGRGDARALVAVATAAAFAGAFAGTRAMHKVTLAGVRRLVGVLLIATALLLGSGIL